MLCRINDFKYKDVVNAGDGVRLGYVGDVELDTESAALTAIVIRGRYRLFGLLGREEDTVIPWEDIQVIGEDTILVRCPAIKKAPGGASGKFCLSSPKSLHRSPRERAERKKMASAPANMRKTACFFAKALV